MSYSMDTGSRGPIPIHFLDTISFLCHDFYIMKEMVSYVLLVFIINDLTDLCILQVLWR